MENANALGWILLAVAVVFVLRTIRTEARNLGRSAHQIRNVKKGNGFATFLGALLMIGYMVGMTMLALSDLPNALDLMIYLTVLWFFLGWLIARKIR